MATRTIQTTIALQGEAAFRREMQSGDLEKLRNLVPEGTFRCILEKINR